MKLVHEMIEKPIELSEEFINVLIVENPRQFTNIIEELYGQIEGLEGGFVLSHDGKPHDTSKNMDILIDLFSADINSKKIISRLYSYLKTTALESRYIETAELLSHLNNYLGYLDSYTSFPLSFDNQADVSVLFKAFNLKLELSHTNLLEKLIEYISVIAEFSEVKCLVLVNIKSYFSEGELLLLYEHALYEKLHLLLIENKMIHPPLKHECIHLIDMDLCEIL